MEDDLKILKVEHIGNQNLEYLKWRQLQMEDNLNILIVKYLSNH